MGRCLIETKCTTAEGSWYSAETEASQALAAIERSYCSYTLDNKASVAILLALAGNHEASVDTYLVALKGRRRSTLANSSAWMQS